MTGTATFLTFLVNAWDRARCSEGKRETERDRHFFYFFFSGGRASEQSGRDRATSERFNV